MSQPNRSRSHGLMSVVLGVFLLAGMAYAPSAQACGFLRQIMGVFSDLFDPELPPWHPTTPYWGGIEQEDFDRLGLNPDEVEPWEDGARMNPNERSFEWWYHDAHFSDGSSVVVVFYTKPITDLDGPSRPLVMINLVTPQQELITKVAQFDPQDAYYGTDHTDVRIGPNYVNGNLQSYQIHASIEDVEIDLTLHRTIPSWRSATGYLFVENEDTYMSWLVPVPEGVMVGNMFYNGEDHAVIGSGYHDHNWGNTGYAEHNKFWWWARAKVQDYVVIAAAQRMKNKYGSDAWAGAFAVIDANGVLIDLTEADVDVTHEESNIGAHPDPNHEAPIAHTVTFWAERDNGDLAEVRFDMVGLLASTDLLETGEYTDFEAFLARLLGKSPWYTRFAVQTTLNFDLDGTTYSGVGLGMLEFMDFE